MDVVFLGNGDDWVFVYVNDEIFHCGHDIPDHIWIRLMMSGPVTTVRRFITDFETYPETYDKRLFSQVPTEHLEEETL